MKRTKSIGVLDDKIADMISNEELYPVVTSLFITRRKLNVFLLFITQSNAVPLQNRSREP